MKKTLTITLAVMLLGALSSCSEKIKEASPGKKIAEIYVTALPGSKSVLVSLDGLWRVKPQVSWITTDVNGREGKAAFTLFYESNESDFANSNPTRKGAVVIESLGSMKADTLYVIQQGIPDGKQYESTMDCSYLEFMDSALKQRRIVYANFEDLEASESGLIVSWIKFYDIDILAAKCPAELRANIYNGLEDTAKDLTNFNDETVFSRKSGIEFSDGISDPPTLTAKIDGLNFAISNFANKDPFNQESYSKIKSVLDFGYDRPGSDPQWFIGGSFYYLSMMETGYPSTPSWFPTNPSDKHFEADRYAQNANLIDCVSMTAKDFNITFSNGTDSWRADYVYASSSAWNSVTAVNIINAPVAAMAHKPIMITIKY